MNKLKRIIVTIAIGSGSLFGVGGAVATIAPTAAHASTACQLAFGSAWIQQTQQTFIYDTDFGDFPWMGNDGNISNWPLVPNETPSGQPGYGWGPYEHFTFCYDGYQIGFIPYNVAYPLFSTSTYSEPVQEVQPPSHATHIFSYNCEVGGNAAQLWNYDSGNNVSLEVANPWGNGQYFGEFADPQGPVGDWFLVGGLCGYPNM